MSVNESPNGDAVGRLHPQRQAALRLALSDSGDVGATLRPFPSLHKNTLTYINIKNSINRKNE